MRAPDFRRLSGRGLLCVTAFLLTSQLTDSAQAADKPSVTRLSPPGLQAGTTTEIKFVGKPGDGTLQVDVRGLASLYSGYRSPEQVALVGQLEGSDDARALAQTVFAGPEPWMADAF